MLRAWFCRDRGCSWQLWVILLHALNTRKVAIFTCFIFLYPLFNPQFTSYVTIRVRKQKLPSNELPIKLSIQIVRMLGYVTKQFHLQILTINLPATLPTIPSSTIQLKLKNTTHRTHFNQNYVALALIRTTASLHLYK